MIKKRENNLYEERKKLDMAWEKLRKDRKELEAIIKYEKAFDKQNIDFFENRSMEKITPMMFYQPLNQILESFQTNPVVLYDTPKKSKKELEIGRMIRNAKNSIQKIERIVLMEQEVVEIENKAQNHNNKIAKTEKLAYELLEKRASLSYNYLKYKKICAKTTLEAKNLTTIIDKLSKEISHEQMKKELTELELSQIGDISTHIKGYRELQRLYIDLKSSIGKKSIQKPKQKPKKTYDIQPLQDIGEFDYYGFELDEKISFLQYEIECYREDKRKNEISLRNEILELKEKNIRLKKSISTKSKTDIPVLSQQIPLYNSNYCSDIRSQIKTLMDELILLEKSNSDKEIKLQEELMEIELLENSKRQMQAETKSLSNYASMKINACDKMLQFYKDTIQQLSLE